MSARKTADQWFAAYGEGHSHRLSALLHGISRPVLFACLLGFIWTIPVPELWQEVVPWFNWTLVAMAAALVFYARLSPAISAGMFLFMAVCHAVIVLVELFAPWSVGSVSTVAFLLAWTVQFIAHLVEHRPPSFARDVCSILIGPAWLLSVVYRRVGQKY